MMRPHYSPVLHAPRGSHPYATEVFPDRPPQYMPYAYPHPPPPPPPPHPQHGHQYPPTMWTHPYPHPPPPPPPQPSSLPMHYANIPPPTPPLPPPQSPHYSTYYPQAPVPPQFIRSKSEGYQSANDYNDDSDYCESDWDRSDFSDEEEDDREFLPVPQRKLWRAASDSQVYTDARRREAACPQTPLPPYTSDPADEIERLKEKLIEIQTELSIQQYREQPQEPLLDSRYCDERRSRYPKHRSRDYEWRDSEMDQLASRLEKVIVVPYSRGVRRRR